MSRNKVSRSSVPEGFTFGLAVVDAIPVILFGVNCLIIGQKLGSMLFLLGAALCLLGGAGKVLWKMIVVLRKKNVWPLFVQMRILMPAGFLMMLAGAILKCVSKSSVGFSVGRPSLCCFAAGVFGMMLMGVFSVRLDNADPKANWIEQITNSLSQAAFFAGLLMM